MRPDDLPLLRRCGSPVLHPDGSYAVVPVQRPDLDADDYTGGLWLVPTDGSGPPRRLTRGHRDTSPAISPDGRLLAFLRSEPRGRPQVHLLELDGGEPVRVTDHPLGAGEPRWSPDSTRLAYVARVPEPGRYGTEDGVGPEAEPPRLITSLAYRLDGLGYSRDRRPHVFVLDVPDLGEASTSEGCVVEPRQVTDGDHSDADVAWTVDGSRLLLTSDRHETRETDLRRGLYAVPAEGGEPQLLAGGDLSAARPVPSPDGSTVYFLASSTGESGTDLVRNAGLFSVSAEGTGSSQGTGLQRLTDEETLDLGETERPVVTGDAVLVTARSRGAVRLLSVPQAGRHSGSDVTVVADPDGGLTGGATVLLDGPLQVLAVDATADGRVVVATVADPGSPGDLHLVAAEGATRLTDVAAPLREQGVRPLVEVTVPADDGYPVHGWAVLPDPERYGPGPYPVLLSIHGGPFAQYGWGLFDEAQVYAGAGYAVLLGNPRGSAGYGQEHGRVIRGAMGGRDAADVQQLLDGALDGDLPLDPERVGIMGGSYGGFMTALLTTRTDRFAAAVVERGYLDASTFVGSADIGWFFPAGYHGTAENMREQSPMSYVERVSTPTLVIHSEEDWRCPVEQGQRWYTALRLNGVEAELLLFPGEGHELTRSGRPRHRRARFEHLLRWWGRHLPVQTC